MAHVGRGVGREFAEGLADRREVVGAFLLVLMRWTCFPRGRPFPVLARWCM
ncbi:hypothetical protein ACFQV8_37770 [Pseudonocardia benzenivorans]